MDAQGGPNHVGNYCDAALMADVKGNKTIYRHPQYWFIGHFSKFLLRGSLRVGSTIATSAAGAAGRRFDRHCSADAYRMHGATWALSARASSTTDRVVGRFDALSGCIGQCHAGPTVDATSDCPGWPSYGKCDGSSIQATAFKRPDGKVACVVLNCGEGDVAFGVNIGGSFFNNTIAAHSIQTFLV